jgi:hypothetical protein
MFPVLLQIQCQSGYKEGIPLLISHLQPLTDSLDQYFPSLSSEMFEWVRNTFVRFSENSLSMQEESNLMNYGAIVV